MTLGNYWHPTPKIWRVIGDSTMMLCSGLSTAIIGSPLSDTKQKWIIFFLNIFGLIVKVFTNFIKEENEESNPTTTHTNNS